MSTSFLHITKNILNYLQRRLISNSFKVCVNFFYFGEIATDEHVILIHGIQKAMEIFATRKFVSQLRSTQCQLH